MKRWLFACMILISFQTDAQTIDLSRLRFVQANWDSTINAIWRDRGTYVEQFRKGDSITLGAGSRSIFTVGVWPPLPQWSLPSGSVYSPLKHSAQFYGAIDITPDSSGYSSAINLYFKTTPARGGGTINTVQWSPRLNKYINTFSMGNDYVVENVGRDSISPVWFWGVRSIDSTLPNNFYDHAVWVGYEYIKAGVGHFYPAQFAWNASSPYPLISHAFGSGTHPGNSQIVGIIRTQADSMNPYLVLAHGSQPIGAFEINRYIRLRAPGSDGNSSPWTGHGWDLDYLDSPSPDSVNYTINRQWWKAGSVLWQMKRTTDSNYSYLSVGDGSVTANAELGMIANKFRVINSGTYPVVISEAGAFYGDSSLAEKVVIPYNGLTNNGIYFGTLTKGVQNIIGMGSTFDQISIGSRYLQGIMIGSTSTGTDMLFARNVFRLQYLFRFYDSLSVLKGQLDSAGNLFIAGTSSFTGLTTHNGGASVKSSYALYGASWDSTGLGALGSRAIWKYDAANNKWIPRADSTGSLTLGDTVRAQKFEVTYSGLTNNGYYFGTQTQGLRNVIGIGSTFDQVRIGDRYVQGIFIGSTGTGTDQLFSRNVFKQQYMFRFYDSSSVLKGQLDSAGNAFFAGELSAGSFKISGTGGTVKITSPGGNGFKFEQAGVGTDIITSGFGKVAINTTSVGDSTLYVVGGFLARGGRFTGPVAIGNTVNAVSPTAPDRTITMVIGGTTYYLAAKTTND